MWRDYLRFMPAPLPKPQPIEPLHLMRRFEDARETGELVVPSELADFAALYQEQTEQRFASVEMLRMPKHTHKSEPSDAVLVPFTGGVASTAALWQALKEGKNVWLFYLEGFSAGEEAERRAIRESVIHARDAHGCPLLILVEKRMQCRLVTLPNSYPVTAEQLTPMHPLAMLALYTQVANAARAHQCGTVLWSGFWEQRPMMRALTRYFTALQPHQAVFAHDDRRAALETLLQASEQSTLTDQGPLTSGPTLGPGLLHRCCSCQRSTAAIAQSQAAVPSPLGGECGECAACVPWIELCVHETDMLVHRQVQCFGTEAEPKPKPKRPPRKAPRRPAKKTPPKEAVLPPLPVFEKPAVKKRQRPVKRPKTAASNATPVALPAPVPPLSVPTPSAEAVLPTATALGKAKRKR